MIAALYIDEMGPYPKLLGAEFCWGASRDARKYEGPWPVVAHPPCGPWGSQRHLSNGAAVDCGPRAVEQVRSLGGVLEHPAYSLLWRAMRLPAPAAPADAFGGYTIEVCQVDWGHPARKRTWLYLVGVTAVVVFPEPREPTHWVSGWRNRQSTGGGKLPGHLKVCSAQQRRRTPVAFAEWLISLARSARPAHLDSAEAGVSRG